VSTPKTSAAVALLATLCVVTGAAAYDPPLPQNRILTPELGPIEPISARFAASLRPVDGADITIAGTGFGTDGRIAYIVVNRGRDAGASPFVTDIDVDGRRADTIKHPALPARSQQRVVSNLASSTGCVATNLRVLADAQQLVAESDETNNALLREDVPPCPDLTVSVEKDSVNNHLEYYAKVHVKNRGNLVAKGPFTVRAEIAAGLGGIPKLKEPTIQSLAPGETFTLKDDEKHWNTTQTHLHVVVDRFGTVRESNENNNVTTATLGGP
jgi:subtilase family serine protease